MKPSRKARIINQMTDQELTVQLVITQLTLLLVSLLGGLFLFDTFINEWMKMFTVTWREWIWFGILPGLLILCLDFILMYILPKRFYDDGGINEKVFQNRSLASIIGITLLVAFSEEMLFRGVLHTEFGYIISSILFAIMHIRYLTKVVLLVSVLSVSFLIGYMFVITNSLTVTITAHFLIDVVLALWIRYRT